MKLYISFTLSFVIFSFGLISINERDRSTFLDDNILGDQIAQQDTIHTGYQVFDPVLNDLQQTSVPLNLPSYLAAEKHSIGDFHAIIETVNSSEYIIQVAAIPECNWNTFCLIGEVSGKIENNFSPPEESVSIQLTNEITGYFSESICTNSCSLSVITWNQNGYTYRIGKKSNQNILIEIANSAIESSIGK